MRKTDLVSILSILAGLCLAATANGELAITEIMSQSLHAGPNGDWWELTNTGPLSVNLTGYSWDDDHQRPGQSIFGGIVIGAGESIIILDHIDSDTLDWRSDWGILGSRPNVYDRTYFSGSFSGLGSSDGVFLYDTDDVLVASVTYPSRTDRFSNEWAADGTSLGPSVVGENGAYQSANVVPDVASPGYAVESEPCSSSGRMMYWTDKDTSRIQRMNLDSGCVENILTSADGLVEPRGLAIDVVNAEMYWVDSSTGVVHRSGLDGSGDVQLVTGLSFPADIALDTGNGKVYFAETGTSSIRCVNIDGSGPIEDVVTGLGQPYYIELDSTNSRIYWSDLQNSVIHRVNLDGTGAEDFITGLNHVRDIVLDLSAGKIYWGDRGSSKIQRANLDGTGGIEDLFGPADGLDRPHGLLLDAAEGKIYWTDTVTSAVHRANMDGNGPVENLVTGLNGPWALAIVMVRKVRYADADATGANDGSSWKDAFNYPQDALSVAKLGDEIWVAQGIYRPDQDTDNPTGTGDRAATFQLKNGVTIKGGYAGYSEPLPDKRDIKRYESVLSGDLDANDADVNDPRDLLTGTTRLENCYHVVTAGDVDAAAVLDGFTITAGNADGSFSDYTGAGGGMFNYGRSIDCRPTVTECTFIGNSAVELGGGGMFNYGHGDGQCNPVLINCAFIGNASATAGGGVCNWGSSPMIANCTFTRNFADGGGAGMANSGFGPPEGSSPSLTNCVFASNSTTGSGGGMSNWEFSSPTLTNCIFAGNSADNEGGGMCNEFHCDPTMANCILWNNSDTGGKDESAQVFNYDSTPVINNSCIQGWTGGLGGTGNIAADPLFRDADGPDNIAGTSDDDLRLMEGSPCIDHGDNAAIPVGTDADPDGHPRIIDGDCNDTDIVDMGAYEFNYAHMGDFDYDCDVDYVDFAVFAPAWLTRTGDVRWNPACNIALPANGFISIPDLHAFAENWLADME
jgi:sugar lactone lactonase YvrE